MLKSRIPFAALLLVVGTAFGIGPSARAQFDSFNVSLYSHLDLADLGTGEGSSCWGYVSPSGREYALMGCSNKLSVVEITNPVNPVIVGSVSHATSSWCEVKAYSTYAYVANENSGGLDVIDLSQVDSGVVSLVQRLTAGGLDTSHTVSVNTASGYLYLNGSNLNSGAPVVYSLADPANPVEVGRWTQGTRAYIHDSQIISYTAGPYAGREILFGASTSRGLDILDVTDKANIFLMSRTSYPGVSYCHQGWSEDLRFFFIDDEADEGSSFAPTTRTMIFDITNLSAPSFLGAFTNGQTAIDHNLYVRDCLIYEANYQSGLRIYAAHDPYAPVEVGWFDTYPEATDFDFDGAWNNYPFFPSGTVIVSDRDRGLFVLDVSAAVAAAAAYERLLFDYPAGRPELIDPHGGDGFRVQVSDRCGTVAVPGTGLLHYDRGAGFVAAPMTPVSPNVYDAAFPPTLCGQEVPYYVTSESTEAQIVADPAAAPAQTFSALSGAFTLHSFDNLETDTGWTTGPNTATAGIWLRGDPNTTNAQPPNDHTPAPGVNCWYTGFNSPLQHNNGDVDGGTTVLTSPLIDLSAGDARVTYFRWYYEGDIGGDDGFLAEISNDDGQSWVEIESLSPGDGGWQEVRFMVRALLPPTNQMRLRFTTTDGPAGDDLVEAAIDDVTIERLVCTPQDADIDNDGDVDLADFALEQACHTGDGGCLCVPALYDAAGQPDCIASDLDLDGDIDLGDYNLFQAGFTGP